MIIRSYFSGLSHHPDTDVEGEAFDDNFVHIGCRLV